MSKWISSRLFWPLCGLLLILLFNAVFVPSFFHLEIRDGHLYGSLVDVLNRGSITVILAIGMTLVIATGGVDLSVGSVMAIVGGVAALLLSESGLALPLVLLVSLAAGVLAGLLNGFLVAVLRIQPIVATLILMVSGRGIAKWITGEKIITLVDDSFNESFSFIGSGHFLGLPFPVTLFLVLLLVTSVLVRKTSAGLFIESVGANELASRASGIRARRVKLFVYAFSGLCAGLAGIIDTSNINAADTINAGVFTELDAIFAVVVGGTALTGGRFTLLGSVIGALLLQTLLTTMYTYGVPPAISPVPKAVVIIGVCLLQSPVVRQNLSSIGRRAKS